MKIPVDSASYPTGWLKCPSSSSAWRPIEAVTLSTSGSVALQSASLTSPLRTTFSTLSRAWKTTTVSTIFSGLRPCTPAAHRTLWTASVCQCRTARSLAQIPTRVLDRTSRFDSSQLGWIQGWLDCRRLSLLRCYVQMTSEKAFSNYGETREVAASLLALSMIASFMSFCVISICWVEEAELATFFWELFFWLNLWQSDCSWQIW